MSHYNLILKNYKIDKTQNNNIKYSFNNIDQDSNSVSETFILSEGSNFLKNEIKGYKGSVEKINSQGDPVKKHAR